jgi:hypothetical protein
MTGNHVAEPCRDHLHCLEVKEPVCARTDLSHSDVKEEARHEMSSQRFEKVVIWKDHADGLDRKEKELENKLTRE